MTAVFALLSAGSFGVGDFLGGLATRRGDGSPVPVLALGHIAGLLLAAVLVFVFPGDEWLRALLVGAGAGGAGAVGLAFLYRGLARGRMGLVAPLTALLAALIPMSWGLLRGERIGALAAAGVTVGLVAIPLISSEPGGAAVVRTRRVPAGFADGVLAGVGFGLFFILIDFAGDGSGAIPLVGARVATVPVLVALARRRGGLARGPVGRLALLAGFFDMVANAWYLAAVRTGLITTTVVLVALAPASTVALARIVEHEHLSRYQLMGLALAVTGVALIGAGT